MTQLPGPPHVPHLRPRAISSEPHKLRAARKIYGLALPPKRNPESQRTYQITRNGVESQISKIQQIQSSQTKTSQQDHKSQSQDQWSQNLNQKKHSSQYHSKQLPQDSNQQSTKLEQDHDHNHKQWQQQENLDNHNHNPKLNSSTKSFGFLQNQKILISVLTVGLSAIISPYVTQSEYYKSMSESLLWQNLEEQPDQKVKVLNKPNIVESQVLKNEQNTNSQQKLNWKNIQDKYHQQTKGQQQQWIQHHRHYDDQYDHDNQMESEPMIINDDAQLLEPQTLFDSLNTMMPTSFFEFLSKKDKEAAKPKAKDKGGDSQPSASKSKSLTAGSSSSLIKKTMDDMNHYLQSLNLKKMNDRAKLGLINIKAKQRAAMKGSFDTTRKNGAGIFPNREKKMPAPKKIGRFGKVVKIEAPLENPEMDWVEREVGNVYGGTDESHSKALDIGDYLISQDLLRIQFDKTALKPDGENKHPTLYTSIGAIRTMSGVGEAGQQHNQLSSLNKQQITQGYVDFRFEMLSFPWTKAENVAKILGPHLPDPSGLSRLGQVLGGEVGQFGGMASEYSEDQLNGQITEPFLEEVHDASGVGEFYRLGVRVIGGGGEYERIREEDDTSDNKKRENVKDKKDSSESNTKKKKEGEEKHKEGEESEKKKKEESESEAKKEHKEGSDKSKDNKEADQKDKKDNEEKEKKESEEKKASSLLEVDPEHITINHDVDGDGLSSSSMSSSSLLQLSVDQNQKVNKKLNQQQNKNKKKLNIKKNLNHLQHLINLNKKHHKNLKKQQNKYQQSQHQLTTHKKHHHHHRSTHHPFARIATLTLSPSSAYPQEIIAHHLENRDDILHLVPEGSFAFTTPLPRGNHLGMPRFGNAAIMDRMFSTVINNSTSSSTSKTGTSTFNSPRFGVYHGPGTIFLRCYGTCTVHELDTEAKDNPTPPLWVNAEYLLGYTGMSGAASDHDGSGTSTSKGLKIESEYTNFFGPTETQEKDKESKENKDSKSTTTSTKEPIKEKGKIPYKAKYLTGVDWTDLKITGRGTVWIQSHGRPVIREPVLEWEDS